MTNRSSVKSQKSPAESTPSHISEQRTEEKSPTAPSGNDDMGTGIAGKPAEKEDESSSAESDRSSDPMFDIFNISHDLPPHIIEKKIKDIVDQQMSAILKRWEKLASKYEIVILHETRSITRFAADRVYRSLRNAATERRPILLIVNSPGGAPSAAYFIAKLCRQHMMNSFDVAIPRRAKSAATLICCGADRLHMGALSELGPIDPQLEGIPLLALRHSVEHIAQLATANPGASRMFSDYLANALKIEAIGYFERVAESSMHYAIQLLKTRSKTTDPHPDMNVARRLVYGYKDHGFVIDVDEASDIFGHERCKRDTDEYKFANEVYESFELIQLVTSSSLGFDFSYVGRPDAGSCWVIKTLTEEDLD